MCSILDQKAATGRQLHSKNLKVQYYLTAQFIVNYITYLVGTLVPVNNAALTVMVISLLGPLVEGLLTWLPQPIGRLLLHTF